MLIIKLPAAEYFDNEQEIFVQYEEVTLRLEHSLVSLSKWEEEFEKPFLDPSQEKTGEEVFGYIRAMVLDDDIPEGVFERFTEEHVQSINAYIERKMTATWFNDAAAPQGPPSREIITAELIYYWIFALQMPYECREWHLNKLFTQIKVMNVKQSKPKKMSPRSAAAERSRLNAQRRAAMETNG